MTSEGLLDRRRHQTEREIRAAALTLFETHGVDGTTVDDIAREAGVSPRTVFRYAATKERAALLPEPAVERQVDTALASLDPGSPLVPQLEHLWRGVLATFDDGADQPGHAGHDVLRLWRLVPREPRLLLAALAVDEERLARTLTTLEESLGLDPLAIRVVLESTGAVVRVTLDRWAQDPGAASLVTAYDEACAALRRHAG